MMDRRQRHGVMGPTSPLGRTATIVAAVVLAVGSGGCQSSGKVVQEVPTPVAPRRAFVEHLLPKLNTDLRAHAEAVATGHALQTYLGRAVQRSWDARVDGGIKYADLFVDLYDKRSYHKAFARSDGLTPRGEALLDGLLQSERHGLKSSNYHVGRIQTLVATVARRTDGQPSWQPVRLSGPEANRLVHWLNQHDLDPAEPETRRRLLSALVGSTVSGEAGPVVADSPVPRITTRLERFLDGFGKTARLTAELELRVADGALRYGRDMKHFNLARQDWRDLRDAGGSKALIYGRLARTYRALSAASASRAGEIMAALQPAHPQYQKLVDVLGRYRAIAADGGWDEVRRTSLDPQSTSRRVRALRQRLAAEGFLSGPDDPRRGPAPAKSERADPNVVDQALIEAVKSYQETHQFRPDGDPTGGFWRSLNVPVGRRIDQIELTMQRWRESRYQGEADFIMVNIPDFHAEVFQDHRRQMRFRVVTGDDKRRCDSETGQWVYPRATPQLMAHMDHIIVNPYWYVPQSIVSGELEPKIRRDPDYLAKNNYEKVDLHGTPAIRQKPGDDNALGRVKFIFPNRHNTYMHDTPSKRFFDYPVRAFSHGCVRVQKPKELARYLLAHDKHGRGYDFDDIYKKGDQKYIELDHKIPVFLEYYTVRVDEQGRPHFLADIYDKDRLRLAEDDQAREAILSCGDTSHPPASADDHSQAAPDDVEADLGP